MLVLFGQCRHLCIQWVPGSLTPGVERPGRQADHSSPSNAEVKIGVVLN
jgi:hypothetical protein